MALQSSQRLPELQFYTKKSYRILQLQFYKGTHTHTSYITYREFSIQNPILHAEDKELFKYYYYIQRAKKPSFQKRNSMHRRQGDLLEIHLCVFQDLPKIFQTFQTFQSFMTIQPFQAILQVPASSGNPPHSSILQIRMHILHILQILWFDWFPQKTPPSTSWTLQTTNIHSSKKGRCCDIGQTCKTCIGQDDKMTYSLE